MSFDVLYLIYYKMKKIILILSIFIGLSSLAQSINSQYRFGGSLGDNIASLQFHANSNSYYFLGTSSSINNDRQGLSYGSSDSWLVKLDLNKNIIWEKSYGGNSAEISQNLLLRNDTLYILSYTYSNESGNKTTLNYGGTDLWLLALDLNGNILWQQSYGGDLSETNSKLVSLPNGDILISAISSSGISGNKTTDISNVLEEPWLLQIHSSDGSIVKQKCIESPLSYQDCSIQVDPYTNELYFMMPAIDGLYGEKTDPGYGGFDLWLTKLDENLNVIYNICFGGEQEDGGSSSLIFTPDNIYLICTTNSSNTGNKTSLINGTISIVNRDYWLIKLTRNLDIVWDKSFGGFGNDVVSGIIKGNGTNIMLYGNSGSSVSGNKTVARYGSWDLWTLMIDSNDGSIFDQNSFGGLEEDNAMGAYITSNQDVLLYGDSYSGISGNKTLASYGENDIWMLELETTSILQVKTLLDKNNISFYPNPFSERLMIDLKDFDENTSLLIYTLEGKKVHEAQLEANSIYEWTTDLEAQVFIYHVTSEEGKTVTGKLVKLTP